jgi:hypothetical protein
VGRQNLILSSRWLPATEISGKWKGKNQHIFWVSFAAAVAAAANHLNGALQQLRK